MAMGRFLIYTFVGSYIWSWGLAWIGMKLGQHWHILGAYFHRFDAVIGIILLIGIIWYIRRHFSH
jgi:membrane protein DedA with SNARE-associated domain